MKVDKDLRQALDALRAEIWRITTTVPASPERDARLRDMYAEEASRHMELIDSTPLTKSVRRVTYSTRTKQETTEREDNANPPATKPEKPKRKVNRRKKVKTPRKAATPRKGGLPHPSTKPKG